MSENTKQKLHGDLKFRLLARRLFEVHPGSGGPRDGSEAGGRGPRNGTAGTQGPVCRAFGIEVARDATGAAGSKGSVTHLHCSAQSHAPQLTERS